MGDTVVTILAIVLAAVLMFIFPLMSVADRSDDVSQLSVQNSTITISLHKKLMQQVIHMI